MLKLFAHFATPLIIALSLALPIQAQEQMAQNKQNHKETATASDFNLFNLLARAKPQKREGFSLMPASLLANIATASPGRMQLAAGANVAVIGNGTGGRLTRWTGFTSSNASIGDSIIFESKSGLIGIGTDSPTSKLTVAGTIESTSGGFKFPDGSVQTTSAAGALFSVAHDNTLRGDGTPASPLSVVHPDALVEPVSDTEFLDLTGSSTVASTIFTVPAGKRLVIEHATANCQLPLGQRFRALGIVTSTDHNLIPVHLGDFGGNSHFVMSQPIKIYAAPLENVVVKAARSFFGGSGNCIFSFSGFLIDLP
jgi:hypothetical protein